jgi:hypothetical protein
MMMRLTDRQREELTQNGIKVNNFHSQGPISIAEFAQGTYTINITFSGTRKQITIYNKFTDTTYQLDAMSTIKLGRLEQTRQYYRYTDRHNKTKINANTFDYFMQSVLDISLRNWIYNNYNNLSGMSERLAQSHYIRQTMREKVESIQKATKPLINDALLLQMNQIDIEVIQKYNQPGYVTLSHKNYSISIQTSRFNTCIDIQNKDSGEQFTKRVPHKKAFDTAIATSAHRSSIFASSSQLPPPTTTFNCKTTQETDKSNQQLFEEQLAKLPELVQSFIDQFKPHNPDLISERDMTQSSTDKKHAAITTEATAERRWSLCSN